MSVRRLIALAGLGLTTTSAVAGAQFMPRVYCPPSQKSCFAAATTYTNYATGLPGHPFLDETPLTVMSLYVQNLQGSYRWSSADAPFQVNSIGFYRGNGGYNNLSKTLFVNILPPVSPKPRSGFNYGPINTGPKPFLSENSSADPITSLTTTFSTDVSGGVMGCNLGRFASPLVGWGWQTCPDAGKNGWVRFDFALYWAQQNGVPRFVNSNNFYLTLGGSTQSESFFCGSGRQIEITVPVGGCPEYAYDAAIVTPEPATLLLLASGLGGIGFVGHRRRRRRDRAA